MVSGVSSINISTPVAASKALIFLPSRPMIRPFTSSDSNGNAVTVLSMANSAAVRWMVCKTIRLASRVAPNLASSTMVFANVSPSECVLALMASIIFSLASSCDKPAIVSNCFNCCSRICDNSTSRFL